MSEVKGWKFDVVSGGEHWQVGARDQFGQMIILPAKDTEAEAQADLERLKLGVLMFELGMHGVDVREMAKLLESVIGHTILDQPKLQPNPFLCREILVTLDRYRAALSRVEGKE